MLKTANSHKASDTEFDDGLSPDHFLEVTLQQSPVLNRIVNDYGDATIQEYLESLRPNADGCYQDRDDLIDIVYHYTRRLLGDEVATRTARDFAKNPIVLTANHHGVDYFSHSFQASLLFSLYRHRSVGHLTTVPVFSCGNIPLDNATYPQGMFFYSGNREQLDALPMKLPVFPNRLRRQLVSRALPFDREMVERSESRLGKMIQEAQIGSTPGQAAGCILAEDYRNPSVLDQSSYSDQAVLVNNRIWKRLFHPDSRLTELIYLELEKIVEKILQIDLRNENSLIYQVMFDPRLREAVLHELDGARACWNLDALKKRNLFGQVNDSDRVYANGNGTIFFWGINNTHRRIPLFLSSSGHQSSALIGIDDHHQSWQLTFSPDSILAALGEGRILPSLFTSFLVLSFARGVRCLGSYFQGEYLPHMQKGLVRALKGITEFQQIAEQVAIIKSNFYLSGMLPVMTLIENELMVPAGPAEIIAGGGLGPIDIEKVLSVTVRDAQIASLLETLPDFVPWLAKSTDWKSQIANDSLKRLEGNVLIR
jgi:hypothetical protein